MVHPRVCGEHRVPENVTDRHYGSSPRVRGTRARTPPRLPAVRFIPACAGNTSGKLNFRDLAKVHPRVCGEHEGKYRPEANLDGSSPRVRGTRAGRAGGTRQLRFIPACAGNTEAAGVRQARPAVHPRVCGEHTGAPLRHRAAHGSSPRVRGTLAGTLGCLVQHRFIPACAGNTRRPRICRRRSQVHPRVCGEHLFRIALCVLSSGSSPRVRGTLVSTGECMSVLRFIPACAGNTDAVTV